MMARDGSQNRDHVEFTSLDALVPEDHLVRKLENAIELTVEVVVGDSAYKPRQLQSIGKTEM